MATTIPDARTIRRQNFTDQTAPIQDRSNLIKRQGMADFAASAGRAYSRFNADEDARADFEASRAEAEFLTAKAEADTAAETDTDYKGMTKRWEESLTEKRDKIAAGLSSTKARERYQFSSDQHLARGKTRVTGMSIMRERDNGRTEIDNSLTGLLNNTTVNSDFESTAAVAEKMIRSGLALGYVNNEAEVEKRMTALRTDLAKVRFSQMTPEQRVKALDDDPTATYLPNDYRAQLKEQAVEQTRQGNAINSVDAWRHQGLSPSQMYRKTDDIKDPKERDMTRSEIDQQSARGRRMRIEGESDLLDRYFPDVATGKVRVKDLPVNVQKALGSSLGTLQNAEAAAASGDQAYAKHSSLPVYTTAQQLAANRDWYGLRDYVNQNRTLLTETDAKNFTSISVKGEAPPEIKSWQTAGQRMTSALKAAGLSDKSEEAEKLNGAFGDWWTDYQAINGKLPDDKTRDEKIDRLLMKRDVDWAPDPYVFEDGGALITAETIQEDDPKGYAAAMRLAQKQAGGKPVSAQLVVDTYKSSMGYK